MPFAKHCLLFVSHQYHHLGGTEIQTRLLADRLSGEYEISVAYPNAAQRQIMLRRPDGTECAYPADPVIFPRTPYRQLGTEQAFTAILGDVRPNIIHFQHFANWPLSIIDQAAPSGAKIVVSLYDYFAITPFYNLAGVFNPEEVLTQQYAESLLGQDGLAYLQQRRELIGRSLARVHQRFVLSDYQRRVMAKFFSVPFDVMEPGIVPFAPISKRKSEPGLRFGYLGTFVPQKGWIALTYAFAKVRAKHPTAQLRMYGQTIPKGQPPEGTTISGVYSHDDLPRILSEFDVGVIPSIFPETFCIVLSEMWQANVPVAASDLGALGDRVIDGRNGKKFAPGDTDDMARALNWFIEHDDWRTWLLPTSRTLDQLAADHDLVYRSLL